MAKELALSEEDAFDMAAFDGLNLDDYAGAGNENVTANDIAIPYINILQKMSPQCDMDDAEYIEGARPSMYFQNVNKFLWKGDEGLEVIPVGYQRNVIEWVPREKGGGLVSVHPMSALHDIPWTPNEKKVPVRNDNGNLLVDTAQHTVMYRSPLTGQFEPALISMKSTAHKKSRLWNSLIAQQLVPGTEKPAPRWLFIWRAKTVREDKADNSWYNFEFSREGVVDTETFIRCDKLHKAHRQGMITGADAGAESGEEIPF